MLEKAKLPPAPRETKIGLSRSLVIQDDPEEENVEFNKIDSTDNHSSETEAPATEKSKVNKNTILPKNAASLDDSIKLSADIQKKITWKSGEPVPYIALVDAFDEISKVVLDVMFIAQMVTTFLCVAFW